jgi:hypothetical protein
LRPGIRFCFGSIVFTTTLCTSTVTSTNIYSGLSLMTTNHISILIILYSVLLHFETYQCIPLFYVILTHQFGVGNSWLKSPWLYVKYIHSQGPPSDKL